MTGTTRRRVLIAGPAALVAPTARADSGKVAALIRAFVGDAHQVTGGMAFDLPELVDNGNAVPLEITIDAPPGAVQEIAVFADGNPLPEVLRLRFGPAAGPPRVATRIRLATSQTVTALARMAGGECRIARVAVLVTLSACIE